MSEYLTKKYNFAEDVALTLLSSNQVIALNRYFGLLDEIESRLDIYPTLDSLLAAQISLETKHPKSHKIYLIYQALARQIFDSATDGSAQESYEADFDHFYQFDPYP